jgi:fructose-1,6-bisphosphatase/sedoheptulose 1,7-bisphosphatase-like protein
MFALSLEVLRVVEDAAVVSARTMGMGDPHTADQAAVESMRRCLDTIAIEGTIVIGEGERDKAPMLYIGEKVGSAKDQKGALAAFGGAHQWLGVLSSACGKAHDQGRGRPQERKNLTG